MYVEIKFSSIYKIFNKPNFCRLFLLLGIVNGLESDDLSKICGRPIKNVVPRVQDTRDPDDNPPGTWPWMGSLGYYSRVDRWIHKCGVSLIAKKFALTAAHCEPTRNNWKVRFGESNLYSNVDDGNVHESQIEEFIIHPDYRDKSYYDVALIKLKQPISRFSKFILPVCLPEEAVEDVNAKAGNTATIAGWGLLMRNGSSTSDDLRSTLLTIYNQEYCNSTHDVQGRNTFTGRIDRNLPNLFQPSLLCAGDDVS